MKRKLIVATLLIFFGACLGACGEAAGVDGMTSDITDTITSDITGDGGTNSLMVGWTAPITNEDGTPLEDLAGYRLYYGYRSGDYSFAVNINKAYTTAEIGGLSTTTWYLAVTAYDYWGNESGFSNEISHTFY